MGDARRLGQKKLNHIYEKSEKEALDNIFKKVYLLQLFWKGVSILARQGFTTVSCQMCCILVEQRTFCHFV